MQDAEEDREKELEQLNEAVSALMETIKELVQENNRLRKKIGYLKEQMDISNKPWR